MSPLEISPPVINASYKDFHSLHFIIIKTIITFVLSILILPTTFSLSLSTTSTSTLHTILTNPDYQSIEDPPLIMSKLLIYGCGTLGTYISHQLLTGFDFSRTILTAITKSHYHHDLIQHEIGDTSRFQLWTYQEFIDNICQNRESRFPNVIFCAPPSEFQNYEEVVQMSMDQFWLGNQYGKFLFTSSDVYGNTNEFFTEKYPKGTINRDIQNSTRNLKPLLEAENIVLDNHGTVMRLAGLYNLKKGPHTYWFSKGKIPVNMGKLSNMVHYEDAASACLKVLSLNNDLVQNKTFLISDGNSLSRKEMYDSVRDLQLFKKRPISMFEYKYNDNDLNGKMYNGSWSNSVLGWRPKYESFTRFMGDLRKEEHKKKIEKEIKNLVN